MAEYIFKGTLSLAGVTFYIVAENETEAKSKANAGKCDDWEIGGAASSDWEIDTDTLELNE